MKSNERIRKDMIPQWKEKRGKIILSTCIVFAIWAVLGYVLTIVKDTKIVFFPLFTLNIFMFLLLSSGLISTIIKIWNDAEHKITSVFDSIFENGVLYITRWTNGLIRLFIKLLVPIIIGVIALLFGAFIGLALAFAPPIDKIGETASYLLICALTILCCFLLSFYILLKYGLFPFILFHSNEENNIGKMIKDSYSMVKNNFKQYFCMNMYYIILSCIPIWLASESTEYLKYEIGMPENTLEIATIIIRIICSCFLVYFSLKKICALDEYYKELLKERSENIEELN